MQRSTSVSVQEQLKALPLFIDGYNPDGIGEVERNVRLELHAMSRERLRPYGLVCVDLFVCDSQAKSVLPRVTTCDSVNWVH